MKMDVQKLTKMGVLCALGVILALYNFPIIPAAPYLRYETGDVPILIGTFMFGPVAGVILTFVVCLIQAYTVNADAGTVGFIMHFIATGTFALVAGLIYKHMRTFVGAILALVAGSLSMVLIMIPSNLFFTVKFWGLPYEQVVDMLWPIFIPFNAIKSGLNSLFTLVLYKVLSRVLQMLTREKVTSTR